MGTPEKVSDSDGHCDPVLDSDQRVSLDDRLSRMHPSGNSLQNLRHSCRCSCLEHCLGIYLCDQWAYAEHLGAGDCEPHLGSYRCHHRVYVLRYGRVELPAFITRPIFCVWAAVVFSTAYAVQSVFIAQFGWLNAPIYAAFLQNLLMSGLFIALFIARRGARGQSLIIAVAKWLGTLAPTVLFGIINNSRFVTGVGISCSIFDLIYIALLVKARQNPRQFTQIHDLRQYSLPEQEIRS